MTDKGNIKRVISVLNQLPANVVYDQRAVIVERANGKCAACLAGIAATIAASERAGTALDYDAFWAMAGDEDRTAAGQPSRAIMLAADFLGIEGGTISALFSSRPIGDDPTIEEAAAALSVLIEEPNNSDPWARAREAMWKTLNFNRYEFPDDTVVGDIITKRDDLDPRHYEITLRHLSLLARGLERMDMAYHGVDGLLFLLDDIGEINVEFVETPLSGFDLSDVKISDDELLCGCGGGKRWVVVDCGGFRMVSTMDVSELQVSP